MCMIFNGVIWPYQISINAKSSNHTRNERIGQLLKIYYWFNANYNDFISRFKILNENAYNLLNEMDV